MVEYVVDYFRVRDGLIYSHVCAPSRQRCLCCACVAAVVFAGVQAYLVCDMLISIHDVCRARRKSLAAGMALALAGRAAALIPAATTTMRSGPIMKAVSTAATATSAVRVLSTRRRGWGVAPGVGGASLVYCANGSARTRWLGHGNGARMMMCSTGAAAAVEVSAEGVEIGASIKIKGDTIRDLKAGGASKDDLKPHIEV